jgi:hypothetical protein
MELIYRNRLIYKLNSKTMKNIKLFLKGIRNNILVLSFFSLLIPLNSLSQAVFIDQNGDTHFNNDVFITNHLNVSNGLSIGGDIETDFNLKIKSYYGYPDICPNYDNSGRIGINSKQFYEIRGQYHYATNTLLTSDKRFKENFRTIDDPLNKLLKLTGKKYDFIIESSDTIGSLLEKEKKEVLRKDKLGFVAQEVEQILPEAVFFDREIGRYYLDYNALIPLIVEAMKAQQLLIESLKNDIKNLNNKTNEKSTAILTDDFKTSTLNQNIPNPFSLNTKIDLFIPNATSRVFLNIYTMQGKQIKQISINERGKTSVTIEGHTLKAGMYLYTLISDGKEVDTKKMILTNQ